MMKKIGVLLPVYKNDREDFLHTAVESIVMQIYTGYKLYIGVDGPVNDSVNNYLKVLDDQQKIQVVWFEKNRGLACVLNDLIKVAKEDGCDYYARMDADDFSLPIRFDKQLAFMEAHPEVDVVGGAIKEIDEKGIDRAKIVSYPLTHEDCRKFFRYRDPLAHPAVMFRPTFFEKVPNGYRPEYRKNQDTMLWYDGFLNGCVFANLPDIILNFRVIDDFYKRRNGWKRAKQMLRDRLRMNKALGYDLSANVFAIGMFCMTIAPLWVKKILYRVR